MGAKTVQMRRGTDCANEEMIRGWRMSYVLLSISAPNSSVSHCLHSLTTHDAD